MTSCDDPLADQAECLLLEELGYDAVLVAAAGDTTGAWMIEIYGDEDSSGLPEARPAVALLARAAVPPPRHTARGRRGAEGYSEVLIALSTRLAAGAAGGRAARGGRRRVRARLPDRARQPSSGCGAACWRPSPSAAPAASTRAGRSPWTPACWAAACASACPWCRATCASEPDYRDMAPELEVRSELAVPVFVDGRAWGAIDLESREPDAFDAEDARVVRAAAAQLGSALARLEAQHAGDPAAAS